MFDFQKLMGTLNVDMKQTKWYDIISSHLMESEFNLFELAKRALLFKSMHGCGCVFEKSLHCMPKNIDKTVKKMSEDFKKIFTKFTKEITSPYASDEVFFISDCSIINLDANTFNILSNSEEEFKNIENIIKENNV